MPMCEGSRSGWVHLECKLVKKMAQSNKAVLVVFGDDDDEIWIPLSVTSEPDKLLPGVTDITISVREWFAQKNGWSIE